MRLKFYKLTAAGNDFVLFYNISNSRKNLKNLAMKVCDRHYGIGADGLLVLNKKGDEFYLDYLNSDGSFAFCGNGTRSAAFWLYKNRIVKKKEFFLNTESGKLNIYVKNKSIYVGMPFLSFIKTNFNLKNKFDFKKISFVKVGVPHLIIETKNIDKIDVVNTGRYFRDLKELGSSGANIDFIELKKIDGDCAEVFIRTYERGVEDETLSCSSGITSSFWALNKLYGIRRARIFSKNKEIFMIELNDKNAVLTGHNRIVFEGEIRL
jgi:diaminopimelate epimerase